MKYDEVQLRLELAVECMLGDILSDYETPEDGDFDYENATLATLADHLSDMMDAHIHDSDDQLEFRGIKING
jgi:hypothetical protein